MERLPHGLCCVQYLRDARRYASGVILLILLILFQRSPLTSSLRTRNTVTPVFVGISSTR